MGFDFNVYSTPLLFGFLQGWVYAVMFWIRAWRHERLSDGLFGCLLAAFTFEIWEYMLGFGGIEILWKQLEFFPRNFNLLIPPLAFIYLKSQFNANYRLTWSENKHAIPFFVFFIYHVVIFLQGPEFVENWKNTLHYPFGIDLIKMAVSFVIQVVYFYWAFKLYRSYRSWAPSQFSDTESVSFIWFRNFLLAFLISSLISWAMTILDFWLQLDFWHDWWDELFNAGLIYYLGIAGYAQQQPRKIQYEPELPVIAKSEKISEEDMAKWKSKLLDLMESEKPFLEPELTLSDLAQRLQLNSSLLSAVINGAFGKNFNDFVNEYRVNEVKKMLATGNSHLSLLGIGLECGFNSKSTFNRAFKKAMGLSPREYQEQSTQA